jgi:hypothetical protein
MDIKISEGLWASAMFPEGILERWRVQDNTDINAGACIAEVRIEDVLHEIIAPTSGRLIMSTLANAIIEPGSIIAQIES